MPWRSFLLEEPYRSAILYRYFQNLPPREIAQRLEVSPAAVEGRLRRGLDQLRARLDHEFGGRAHWSAALLPLLGVGPAGVVGAGSVATAGGGMGGAAGVASSTATGAGTATGNAAGSMASASTSLLTGALVMSTKIKIVAAIAVLVATAVVLWYRSHGRQTAWARTEIPRCVRKPSGHVPSSAPLDGHVTRGPGR